MPVPCRLILVALVCTASSVQAGEFAANPPAQGMVMPLPDTGMANSAPSAAPSPAAPAPSTTAEPANGRRRLQALGSGFPSTEGRLPNQRTGPRREHVVHDICIGC
ncbi:hypothetical protein [Methylobacterium pseudosasicola]|uniref:Uncharacterized protein n=1 Tax=Methylobacterium pseudosasicola TaxID=582667 RepID=A0A1I4NEL7_9HYPH|nr:hypothetical protein [Methylobacterium pseudosasicola]SFM13747.1 hypothetical protein SAMN05192568_102083 [Methylobacterium pseudosasicola]